MSHEPDDDRFAEDDDYGSEQLTPSEADHVRQDLADLAEFQATFAPEGYRGVSIWCQDCIEEHLYPWEMLRGNLEMLLEIGETPVHEPAFAPDPQRYLPWDYARGYVDALRDAGVYERIDLTTCGRCGSGLPDGLTHANFCPRCGTPLLAQRLEDALREAGLEDETLRQVLRRAGLAGRE